MNTGDPQVAKEFLARYPDSVYREEVQEHLEELKDRPVYEGYAQQHTIEAYREFIAKYPESFFVTEAKIQLVKLEKEEEAKHFVEEWTRERQRLCSLIPKDKQIATRKFLIKIQGIFDSMESYHYASLSSRYGSGILRKDIDRHTDAIAEATGAVPDPVIAYVEDAYQLLRRKLGSTDSHDWSRSFLEELTIRQFAAPTDLTVLCK